MIARSVEFPMPFGKMDFISLIEPDGVSETEMFFVHRLYLVSQLAEGGKILITQRRGLAMKKADAQPLIGGA